MLSFRCVPFFGMVLLGSCMMSMSMLMDRKMIQELFDCPLCDKDACPLPSEPCELVLEPGICGCCPVCARRGGETCGVRVGRCAQGYKCRPDPSDTNPLNALLYGRAVCIGQDPYAALFENYFIKGH